MGLEGYVGVIGNRILGRTLQKGLAREEAWTCLRAAEWSWQSGPLQAVLRVQGVNLGFPHIGWPPNLLGSL